MNDYNRLLLENKSWSQERLEHDPEYFNKLARVQTPKFLWIGCADSRVPPNEITGTKPGEIFIHRNVANLVVNTDLNMLSALQYAVEVLKVEHVIVCGHYGCGGVKAAMSNDSFGLINKWLRNIKDVYRLHRDDVNAIKNDEDRVNKLVEFNVIEQLQNLSKTTIIQKSWKRRQSPELHGWVFGLNDGLIKELINIKPGTVIDPIYRYDHFEDED